MRRRLLLSALAGVLMSIGLEISVWRTFAFMLGLIIFVGVETGDLA